MEMIETVKAICEPMCSNPHALDIRITPGRSESTVEITVTADKADVSRLIGRQGTTATAIRSAMSVKTRGTRQRVFVKFQSHDEE